MFMLHILISAQYNEGDQRVSELISRSNKQVYGRHMLGVVKDDAYGETFTLLTSIFQAPAYQCSKILHNQSILLMDSKKSE